MDKFINRTTKPSNNCNAEIQSTSAPVERSILQDSIISSPNAVEVNQITNGRIRDILSNGKIQENGAVPVFQLIPTDPFVSTDFVLLEFDKEFIEEFLSTSENERDSLTIRGRQSDFAVACTKNKTMQVKEVESSDSYLLLSGLDHKDQNIDLEFFETSVLSIGNCFLEVMESSPIPCNRLYELLQSNVINFCESEEEISQNANAGLTWEVLLNEIQLSKEQIELELLKYPVVERNERIWLLSDTHRWKLLDAIIECCDTRNSNYDNSTTKIFLSPNELEGICDSSKKWIFREFCTPIDSDCQLYELNEESICKTRSEQLLKSNREKEWQLDEFKALIESQLPSGFCFSYVHHLRGLALLSESLVYGKTIKALLKDDLPKCAVSRLKKLFSLQSTWSKDDIEPYVLDFCPNESKVEEFLMKHCRVILRESEKLYCLKQL